MENKTLLITARGNEKVVGKEWADIERIAIARNISDITLSKKNKGRFIKVELEIEELYAYGMSDKIYELLVLGANNEYENSIIQTFPKHNAIEVGRMYKLNIDRAELESRYQEHLYDLFEGYQLRV